MLKKLKKIAKDLLAIGFVRRTYNTLNRGILALGGTTRLGATVYATIGFVTFNREQWAVLSGRRSYYRNLHRERATHVELRRNVHRLEKGMLMQPRRDVFARDYIGETVEFYEYAMKRVGTTISLDASEMRWAADVLTAYFAAVSADDPTIAKARAQFEALPSFEEPGAIRPYPQSEIHKTEISYDDMLALAESRRSIRWFEDRQVPRELIDKALMVGRQSPSACNRLPYEFLIFDDPAQVKTIASIPFGAGGYAHQIPTVIVVKGDLSSYFSPRDRHVPYIDASLATMGFIYALETLGLSSSIINWPDFEPLESKMAKTLGLAPHERVIMLIAVGYADPQALVAYSQKKELDTIRRYNALEG